MLRVSYFFMDTIYVLLGLKCVRMLQWYCTYRRVKFMLSLILGVCFREKALHFGIDWPEFYKAQLETFWWRQAVSPQWLVTDIYRLKSSPTWYVISILETCLHVRECYNVHMYTCMYISKLLLMQCRCGQWAVFFHWLLATWFLKGATIWIIFIRLLDIMDILCARQIPVEKCGHLESLISDHHLNFKQLYPDASITVKMHSMIHLPRLSRLIYE